MIRVCPKRDAVCPHGMACPYTIDCYECAEEPSPEGGGEEAFSTLRAANEARQNVCANGYAIAQMVRMPGEFEVERQANARVMAAAWELLDAAKYLSQIGDAIWIRGLSDGEAAALKRGYEALDAAIAKAEGAQ